MMPASLDIGDISASLNPENGTWRLTAGDTGFTLRPWRWGERRRLIAAASPDGRFDREAFLAGLVKLLFDPVPPEELTPLFALAAMQLMDVPDADTVPPLAEAERALADRYGWSPGTLENERAEDMDRMLAGATPAPVEPPPGAGWTSIRFGSPLGGRT